MINSFTIDYCGALDTGAWDELRSVFTSDVTADLGAGGQHGIEEIIERVSLRWVGSTTASTW